MDEVRISSVCRKSTEMAFNTNEFLSKPIVAIATTNYFVGYGQTLTMPATIFGTAPLTNQWYQDGVALPGQTNTALAISNVTFAANGTYELMSTNAYGNAGRLFWGQSVRQVLEKEGVPPDFEVSGVSDEGTIDWIHRTAGDAEIYYVASRWARPEKIRCAFCVSGKQPELWDPVTGERRDATAFRQEDGRTSIPLEFGPCGSIFVVFQKPIPTDASGKIASNYPDLRQLSTLSGPWTVDFDPKWGGPAKVVFDQLIDWTNSPEPGIKYYSGTAVYHKQFDWQGKLAKGQRLLLDLGEVDDIATVQLNGRDLGVLWTKPARVDITGAVKAGNNKLEITVVNLWPNRLIRDESLPKELRLTETNIHKFGSSSPLLPSGLVGPVSMLTTELPLPK